MLSTRCLRLVKEGRFIVLTALLFIGLSGLFQSSYGDDAMVLGSYPLDEGSGTVAGDVSGQGNDGMLVVSAGLKM